MKEISLNILDITENSVKAGAELVRILISEDSEKLELQISDNGCGMSEETLSRVTDPFYTTRTTRKVGLGLPLIKMAAEQTGGSLEIFSKTKESFPDEHGTDVIVKFYKNHIDFTPLGDVVSTVTTLIQGHPETDFLFQHKMEDKEVELDTRVIRETLGPEIPLNQYEVLQWIEQELNEQYGNP